MDCFTGRLLVSSPELVDLNFRRCVVLLLDHNEDGAMGIVLNRPGGPKLRQLLSAIPTPEDADAGPPPEGRTFVGGPVQPQLVTMLHGFEQLEHAGQAVVPGVRASHDLEVLHQILELMGGNDGSSEEVFRLYCGYSGWGAGQLEQEIQTGSWLVVNAEREHVFDCPTGFLWGRAIGQLGEPFRRFSLMPFNPEAN